MKNIDTLRKTTALLVFVLITVLAHAQSADSTTTRFCKVSLTNGTHVTGQLISEDSANVMVSNQTLGVITVLMPNVESVQVVELGGTYSFVVSSGQIYRGVVTAQNEREITVKTKSGNVKLISANITDFNSGITETAVTEYDHGSRYLFAPSAIPLKKGEGYYQNMMLLMNGAQYGITDHFSIGAGIIAPIGVYATVKYGHQVGTNLHVAAGGMVVTTMFGVDYGVGCGFGSVTYGNRYSNVTATIGYGALQNRDSWYTTKRPIINVSGMVRVTNGFSLITENYFFPVKDRFTYSNPNNSEETYSYNPQCSAGFRIGGGQHTFDVAGMTIGNVAAGDVYLIPYFSYTFHFKREAR